LVNLSVCSLEPAGPKGSAGFLTLKIVQSFILIINIDLLIALTLTFSTIFLQSTFLDSENGYKTFSKTKQPALA
jgi:hypothetical protein